MDDFDDIDHPYRQFPSHYVTMTACGVSMISGGILLFLLLSGRLKIGQCHMMFVSLTISDIFSAGSNFIGVLRETGVIPDNHTSILYSKCNCTAVCVGQSFVTTWASISTFLWTIIIEFYCSWMVLRTNSPNQRQQRMSFRTKLMLSFPCATIPMTISIVALFQGVLGADKSMTSGGWCWIVSCKDFSVPMRILWMLVAGKFWEILSYLTIANLLFIKLVKIYLQQRRLRTTSVIGLIDSGQERRTEDDEETRENIESSIRLNQFDNELQQWKMLFYIPFCLILARIWGTIRFAFNLYEITHGGYLPKAILKLDTGLIYLHGIGDSSQATCNLLLVLIFRRESLSICSRDQPDSERDYSE